MTTAKVVVTNICFGGTISALIISTNENPTAPLKPPYAVMNCSCRLIFLTRFRFTIHVKTYTPEKQSSISRKISFLVVIYMIYAERNIIIQELTNKSAYKAKR